MSFNASLVTCFMNRFFSSRIYKIIEPCRSIGISMKFLLDALGHGLAFLVVIIILILSIVC